MKPAEFDYACPRELDEVFELLEAHGDEARILAGGQSLMPTLNMRLSSPTLLIDINRIEALTGIEVAGDVLRVGALTRHSDLEMSEKVAEHAPLLRAAVKHVAHPAIRNRGTIGGSVAFADPAAELPACALALGASIVLRGKTGERRVPARDFFVDLYETARAEQEVLAAVEIPLRSATTRFGFDELARRHGDYALVGLAATADFDGQTISSLRLAYFGVGNTPVLAQSAEAAEGRQLAADLIDELQSAVRADLDPNDDLQASAAMKKHLASVLTRRVLQGMVA